MPTLTQGRRDGEFIITEAPGTLSRETVVIAASQTVLVGSVLGQVTANGQYVLVNPAATDGSQTAAAIAIRAATTGAGQTTRLEVIDCLAEVLRTSLSFGSLNSGQQTTAISQLRSRNIKVREALS